MNIDVMTRISQIPEGGVSIVFLCGARRTVLDVYEAGEIVAAMCNDGGETEIWKVKKTQTPLAQTLERFRSFLNREPSK